MIYFLRSATVAPGKLTPAMAFAREISEYVKKKTGKNVTIGIPIGGQSSRIGWFIEYEDLAELDKVQTGLLQDSEYVAITAKGGENFVAGSLHDDIWRTL